MVLWGRPAWGASVVWPPARRQQVAPACLTRCVPLLGAPAPAALPPGLGALAPRAGPHPAVGEQPGTSGHLRAGARPERPLPAAPEGGASRGHLASGGLGGHRKGLRFLWAWSIPVCCASSHPRTRWSLRWGRGSCPAGPPAGRQGGGCPAGAWGPCWPWAGGQEPERAWLHCPGCQAPQSMLALGHPGGTVLSCVTVPPPPPAQGVGQGWGCSRPRGGWAPPSECSLSSLVLIAQAGSGLWGRRVGAPLSTRGWPRPGRVEHLHTPGARAGTAASGRLL